LRVVGGLRLKHHRPLLVLTEGDLRKRLNGSETGEVLLLR
jgi:hypothetical protein